MNKFCVRWTTHLLQTSTFLSSYRAEDFFKRRLKLLGSLENAKKADAFSLHYDVKYQIYDEIYKEETPETTTTAQWVQRYKSIIIWDSQQVSCLKCLAPKSSFSITTDEQKSRNEKINMK